MLTDECGKPAASELENFEAQTSAAVRFSAERRDVSCFFRPVVPQKTPGVGKRT